MQWNTTRRRDLPGDIDVWESSIVLVNTRKTVASPKFLDDKSVRTSTGLDAEV